MGSVKSWKGLHFFTAHIMQKVDEEYVSIHDNATITPKEDWPEPRRADPELVAKLEDLFKNGADLAFEMDFGFADEGGNCYQAFILKKEFVAEYSDAQVNMNDPTFPAKWFAQHPEQYWILWQGPY